MIYKVYIPKQSNDGKPFNQSLVLNELAQITEGFTVYDGQGYWKGKFEPVWIFEIGEDESNTDFEEDIKEMLGYLKAVMEQEAMYYVKLSSEGVLV